MFSVRIRYQIPTMFRTKDALSFIFFDSKRNRYLFPFSVMAQFVFALLLFVFTSAWLRLFKNSLWLSPICVCVCVGLAQLHSCQCLRIPFKRHVFHNATVLATARMDLSDTKKVSVFSDTHTHASNSSALALFSFRQHLFIKRSCIEFVPNDLMPLLRYSCRIQTPIRLFSVSVFIVFVGLLIFLCISVGTFACAYVFRWISSIIQT